MKGPGILFVFAHGAGASSSSLWMRAWAERLSSLGEVVSFDYPYMKEGRKAPDRLPKLIEAHRAALAAARKRHPGLRRTVLIGKSMGARVGCHLSTEESVDAVICLGYPLKSPAKNAALRDEVLLAMTAPVLFVQGTRDALCPLDALAGVRARLKNKNALCLVETGSHGLEITAKRKKERGITQEDSDAAVLAAIGVFLRGTI